MTATVPSQKKRINLAWNASSDATSYTIKRSTTSGGPYATIATGVTATTYVNSGLASKTTYYYVVTAVNGKPLKDDDDPNAVRYLADARTLFALVDAAKAGDTAAGATDGIEFVDEHDRRGHRLGLVEQVAHATGTDTDEHLDELGCRHREERHVGLTGDRLGEQRLARAGRSHQQHPVRRAGAEGPVSLGRAEEVDDLDQFLLRLLDTGHVCEGDLGRQRVGAGGLRPTEATDSTHPAHPAHRAAGSAHQPQVTADQQQGRAEVQQQREEPVGASSRRLGGDLHTVVE
jgi:hypothetical protein